MYVLLFIVLCCLSAGCGSQSRPAAADEFHLRAVTLPDGFVVKVEVMTHDMDLMRGMMFRDSLPEDRGMLFIRGSSGKQSYWMYQVKIPLDIIWMNGQGRVVEISENTPPCTTNAKQCPMYGGTVESLVVLELPGGSGRKHGVQVGEVIKF